MARAVVRVTWKSDGAEVVDGHRYSGSVNTNETRRILTGVNRPEQTETGPFHLVGASFYETPVGQAEPDVPDLVDALRAMLLHFRDRLPNGNPRAQVQTVAITLWNITGPDEAEGTPQVDVEPQDLSETEASRRTDRAA